MKKSIDRSKRFWIRKENKVIATFTSKAAANNKLYDIACCNASTSCRVWDNEKKTYC